MKRNREASTALVPANLPPPPQPSALELRNMSSRILEHLVPCLVDHIILFHQSEEDALAACDFAIGKIKAQVRARAKEFRKG